VNPRWPTLALLLIAAPLFAIGAGGWVRIVYPAVAVGLGLFLEARSAPAYVGFVLWVWVLSPLVRRLSDFQAGWQDPSVLILTPYLVTAFSAAVRCWCPRDAWCSRSSVAGRHSGCRSA
jgi:hypothetical protein